MKITSPLFDAFLKCATKCHLRSLAEAGSGNEYAAWVRGRDESYQCEAARRLQEAVPEAERVVAPPATENLKAAKWRLAVDLVAQTPNRFMDSSLGADATLTDHDLPKTPPSPCPLPAMRGEGGRRPGEGRLIESDVHEPGPNEETRGLGGPRSEQLLESRLPAIERVPSEGRGKALEKDDLSLLAGMSEKERKELHSRGIFTVTQLSYTFRPRRRPRRLRDKREKYHHSLKALAIREKKIHIVGSPELKIEGTPVYLDVEGLPDRDFYYLIGVRIGNGESAVQHSLWADTVEDEGKIWRQFLAILETVEKPVLIHYGSYETNFLKQMKDRHGSLLEGSTVATTMGSATNLVRVMFAQTYFPTYSNGLKEVAGWLGFKWSEPGTSGTQSVVWRDSWDKKQESAVKAKVITYNAEDCKALALMQDAISGLCMCREAQAATGKEAQVVFTDDLKHPLVNKWREFSSPLSELEFVNKAAHWDYQRDRIYVRSSKRLKRLRGTKPDGKMMWRVDKVVRGEISRQCPRCMGKGVKRGAVRFKRIQEILFGRSSLKRRVFRYEYQPFWCSKCKTAFGVDQNRLGPGNRFKCGRSVHALVFYKVIELCIPVRAVARELGRLLGLHLNSSAFRFWKRDMAAYYNQTHQQILERIVSGDLVHADETHVSIKGTRAYVWVLTNMHEVAYLYSESRESELVQTTLSGFKGVLVSDFYAVYDSFECAQQKCLIHLVRDLNGTMLDNPYDEELKHLVKSFGQLLKTIVEDVDRHGLKRHFLRKHVVAVDRFYRKAVRAEYQSPAALACRDRFEKNRDKLFTFLLFDGVPWNNNNAEHAVKAFAKLRDVIEGSSTEKGIREYLILLSVCQTCKYMGVDFLDFLRSGEKDIRAFADSRPGRRRRTKTSQPTGLPTDAILGTGG
ncbi:MAG: TM0106 family RecB-like putative nuclease [Limisphaerales bacterium]